jgi:hypothetical protein
MVDRVMPAPDFFLAVKGHVAGTTTNSSRVADSLIERVRYQGPNDHLEVSSRQHFPRHFTRFPRPSGRSLLNTEAGHMARNTLSCTER